MSYDALKLKNQLCFPLYAASREIVKKYKPYLDEIGLTYTQYITMMVLWECESVSVKALGDELYLDSGTLTPLLKKMEAGGLVKRQRSSQDERSVIVSITEKGMTLREPASVIPLKMSKCLPISQEEASTLYGILYKILAQVEKE